MQAGVIGVGAMGAGIAARLNDRGHQVHVRDVDPVRVNAMRELGLTDYADSAALAAQADVVFIVVVSADQIREVLQGPHGLLAGIAAQARPADKTVFFCSTIDPDDVADFAQQVIEAGARAVDAPISGGPARARDGSMSMMMAAPAALLDKHAQLLDDIAQHQFRISPHPGDGARAKLVNNLAGGIHLVAAAEALGLARRFGLDVAQMQKLMAVSSGQSWVADDRMPRALADDFEPRAATRVLTKDLTIATAAAKKAGAPTPLGTQALHQFMAACAAGLAEQDDAALYKYFRDLE